MVEKPSEGKENDIWEEILSSVVKRDNGHAGKTLLLLGDKGAGKSQLLVKLQRGEALSADSTRLALGYTYLDVFSSEEREDQEGEPLARLNIWILEGEGKNKDLLSLAVNAKNVSDAMVAIMVDLSKPWTIMETLTHWMAVVEEHVSGVLQQLSPDRADALKAGVSSYLQSYSEPSDVAAKRAAAASSRSSRDSVPNVAGSAEVKVPLAEGGEWKNLGIALAVVAVKSDMLASLEKELEYTDLHFDFIQNHLRTFCLKYGAALVYVSAKEDKNCALLRDYVVHRLYSLPLLHPPQVVHKDAVFVPSGWDEPHKIRALVDHHTSHLTATCRFEDLIVKPTQRSHAVGAAASDVKDVEEQELLKALLDTSGGTAIDKPSIKSIYADLKRSAASSPPSALTSASPSARVASPGPPTSSTASSPQYSTSPAPSGGSGSKGAAAGGVGSEDALQSFFQNLLNRPQTSKARTPEQARKDAVRELNDKVRRSGKAADSSKSPGVK